MSYGGGYGGPGGYGQPPQGVGGGYGYGAPQGNYPPQGGFPPQGGYGQPGGQYGEPQYGGQYGGGQQNYGPPQGDFGQQQFPPQDGGYESRAGGNKRAVICACNYAGTSAQLGGCINDAHCMAYLLESKFGFQKPQMRLLLDDSPDPNQRPTRANMLEGIQWLLSGCQPGDSLFFHYSGHGSQSRDATGLESDGMNETLCPTDFQTAGQIIDDELNARLINPLPHGVKLHVVIDACHSGSVCDVEYMAVVSGGRPSWKQEYATRPNIHKGTAGGRAIQFGAATDDQTAADTNKLSGNVSTGAATFSFIQAVERVGTHISYGTLLHEMHRSLKEMNKGTPGSGGGGGGGSSSMSSLLGGGGGGLSGMLGGGGGGGGGKFGTLMNVGMSLLSRGGGGDIGSMLGSLINQSNSGQWKKQTPVLSCNEAFDFNMPVQL